MTLTAHPGSFRDPAGRVYTDDTGVYRAVFPAGAANFEAAWQAGILQDMAAQKRLVATALLTGDARVAGASHLLSHPPLPLVTYPYEWPFAALKSAALAHLGLHLALLEKGFTLSDASAFNMQFDGAHPLHMDILSVIPYREGMRWEGYRQFLRHFLNPLWLESKTGVAFAPWFQSSLEGISSADTLRLLPLGNALRPGWWLHVAMPAKGEGMQTPKGGTASMRPLPKARLAGLLTHLHMLIESLNPPAAKSHWQYYSATTSYLAEAAQAKQESIRAFIAARKPGMLLDIGCNTGDYALLALEAGAGRVIGLDTDRASMDIAFTRSAAAKLAFTPLVMDFAAPSPALGWQCRERESFHNRLRADAVLALALLHHLAIGQNIPLPDIMEAITALAPCGVIEFVPKSDPQVQAMLRMRPDIFSDYNEEAARAHLSRHARITSEQRMGDTGRLLFHFERAS